jgi:hypothetical protein
LPVGSIRVDESRVRIAPWSIAAAILFGAAGSSAVPRADVAWRAPAACPQEDGVRALIATWLGQSATELDLGSVRVDATVSRQSAGFSLDLVLESEAGSARERLSARHCETLAKTVALKVALAVDPAAALASVEPEPRSTRKRPPTPVPAPGGGLRAVGGIALGPLPGVTAATLLVGSLRYRDFRFELGGGYWFPRSITYDELPTVGATLRMFGAVARVCPTASIGRVEVPLCAGVEAGIVRAEGFGVPERRTSDRPWVALTLGPGLAVPLSGAWYLWAEADAGFGVVVPSFRVRNLPRLYQPENGAAQAWAGLEARFQ